ncbi:MAG TPA: SIS domain-containing protein [Bacillota bacterium]|nr:SIS domain-containing protein [Bacillota bacterium]
MTSSTDIIWENLSETARLLLLLGFKEFSIMAQIADAIVHAYQHGGKVLLIGNGGSASQAEHLATEFVSRFKMKRSALPALALTVNSSLTSALANDFGFEEVFTRQIEGLAQPGDILIAISTSGSSTNIIRAVETAKSKQVLTVGWTGAQGSELAEKVDFALMVPSNDTPRIQEAHLVAGHIICSLVELTLFGGSNV